MKITYHEILFEVVSVLNKKIRAQELSVKDWVELYKKITKIKDKNVVLFFKSLEIKFTISFYCLPLKKPGFPQSFYTFVLHLQGLDLMQVPLQSFLLP